jgi:hypothetical protein
MREFLAVAMFLLLGAASPRSDITFNDVTDETNLKYQSGDAFEVFQSSWIDINDDGFLDLWVANHAYGLRNDPMLYINENGQTFRNAFGEYFPNLHRSDNHGTNWGDYDNDGDLDMYNNCGGAAGSGKVTARAL